MHATRLRDVLTGEGILARRPTDCPGQRTRDETETLLVTEGGDPARWWSIGPDCLRRETIALWPDEGVLVSEDELGQIEVAGELAEGPTKFA